MSYKIVIRKQAKKKLLSINKIDRVRIVEKIELLGFDPDNKQLDVKKLVGYDFYRLRVGYWRVIFDRQDKFKIIKIERIKPRGDIYK